MMRHLRGPASALALSTISWSPSAAQAIALGDPLPPDPAPALAASYRVVLRSAWPQLAASADCESGGSETVEGVLTRTPSGDYAGSFARHTRLLFCGAHGAGGEACTLVLEGDGRVAMRGRVVDGTSVKLSWTPSAGHAAQAHGACDSAFKEGVERMYLTVRHGAEFALPPAGAPPRRERLEDYAWIVEVE